MTTIESLLIELPTLTLATTVGEVMDILEKSDYSHLTVVDADRRWIGNLASSLVHELNKTQTIASISYLLEPFFVDPAADLAKIADIFIENRSDILPVLDTEHHVIGMLPKAAITANLLNSTFLTEVGTTIIIEHNTDACSLSHIAQIVEGNNSKLLGIFIMSTHEQKTQVLLRLTQKNVDTIIQDLRRHDFAIISQHQEDLHQTKLIEHSNYLNKFLNI